MSFFSNLLGSFLFGKGFSFKNIGMIALFVFLAGGCIYISQTVNSNKTLKKEAVQQQEKINEQAVVIKDTIKEVTKTKEIGDLSVKQTQKLSDVKLSSKERVSKIIESTQVKIDSVKADATLSDKQKTDGVSSANIDAIYIAYNFAIQK